MFLPMQKHGGEGVVRDITLEKIYILELVVVGNKNQMDRDMQQINSKCACLNPLCYMSLMDPSAILKII